MNENPPPSNYSQPSPNMAERGYYPPGIHWEFIGEAFNLIKANPGTWIGGGVAVIVISSVLGQIGSLFGNMVAYGSLVGPSDPTTFDGAKFFLALAVSIPISLLLQGVSTCLYAGMASMAGEQMQTGYVRLKIFDYMGNVIKTSGTTILYWIIVSIGLLLFIVPGIYLAGRLTMAPYYSAIEGLGPMEALKKSWDTFENHAWSMFALIFVAGIVSALGVLACCVGLFYTFPVFSIVIGLTLVAFHPNIFGGMPNQGNPASPSPYPREDNNPPAGWPPVGP